VSARAGVLVVVGIALASIGAVPSDLAAQDGTVSGWGRAVDASGASASAATAWMGAWSPLRPIVDITRGLLRAPLGPGLLIAPAPMAGAFVVGGAPGALARDLQPRLRGDTSRFGDVRIRYANEAGSYRRPLDMAQSAVTQVAGAGFAPVGSRGVVMGSFVLDREQHDTSSFTQRVSAYGSSPFVVTDSVTPPMQRTRARLEGALGLRLGGFGVGLSAGLESREHYSVDFPLRRSGRNAIPAVSAGIERVLPWYGARVGAFYRWSEANETNSLNPNPLSTNVYQVQGYDEPVGLTVTAANQLFVRNEKRATSVGGSLELAVLGARVVVVHEQGDRAEDQFFNVVVAVRATDVWRATGQSTRLQVQRAVGRRGRLNVVGARSSLTGSASRRDLRGIAIDASDASTAVEADLRWTFSPRWEAALIGGLQQQTSQRTDYVAELRSTIETVAPFVGGEVSRTFGRSGVAAGASFAAVTPSGNVPIAVGKGTSYRRLIAPMLAYESADTRAFAAWATARSAIRAMPVWVSARADKASAATARASRLQPGGERTLFTLTMGIRP